MMQDSYLRSLDIATHQRTRQCRQTPEQRREAWYRIGCVVGGSLLALVLAALVTAR